ncbi:hypothetical protein Tco_0542303 [Tanacetum coccineum]
MDPNSSLGKICLGDDVIEISSDKVEGSGDWNSPKYQDTNGSKGKKETKAMVFDKMDTEEVSDRFVAPCFVNGLKAYDGEINIGVEENMILNEFAVKLCLEHEVKRGSKVVKKELIVALRGELYFVKFIINPEEDNVEPEFGEELPPLVCKIGKSSRNKKRAMEYLSFFYQDLGTSSSIRRHLTQEEAAKEELAIRIYQKFFLLEEVRPILKAMAYHDKYKKVLDEIWKDNVELDGMIVKEEEEAIKKVKADTGSDINTMPYRIYEQLGKEEMKKVDREIMMINHTQAEAMGILTNVLFGRGFLHIIGGIVNTPERLFLTFDGFCHQTFRVARFDVLRIAKSDSDDEEEYEIKRNKFGAPIYGPKPAPYLNCTNLTEQSIALQAVINPFWKISVWKKAVSFLGSLPVPLKHVNWKLDYKGCYTNEEEATG